jgi:hypothetical protein
MICEGKHVATFTGIFRLSFLRNANTLTALVKLKLNPGIVYIVVTFIV